MHDGPTVEAKTGPPHVIVDCDPGIDDALALLILAQAHLAGELILDSVFTVGGNVSATQTAFNAALTLEGAGLSGSIVVQGAEAPTGSRVIGTGKSFHGADGLGGLATRPHNAPTVSRDPGKELANRIVANREGTALLCTGPLTNIALALQSDPTIAESVSRVVIMGGALGNPPGNITPVAEFNFYVDPVAASIVVASRLPIELVTLDVTEAVSFDANDLDGLSGFARALLTASLRLHLDALGTSVCYIHDAIAAIVLLDPTSATSVPLAMSITTTGEEAGHVATNEEAIEGFSKVEAVRSIDRLRVKALFHDMLAPRGVVGQPESTNDRS